MATHARRAAYLTVVDAIAQRNHLARGSFGNGKTRDRSRSCVWMRTLRRFGGDCGDIAGRSRRTRTGSDRRGISCGTTLIDNSICVPLLDSGLRTERLKTIMSHRPEDNIVQRDKHELARFGYAQELFLTMGGFSNFALSFSIISILTGAVTLSDYGLSLGGPAEMAFGWPLVAFFTLAVAASMGELASAFPTSGGTYHWASLLGGRGVGWFTAWLNIVGLVATLAAVDYGCALFVTPLLGFRSTTPTIRLVYAAILISHGAINHYGIRP